MDIGADSVRVHTSLGDCGHGPLHSNTYISLLKSVAGGSVDDDFQRVGRGTAEREYENPKRLFCVY